jgi:rubredoxin
MPPVLSMDMKCPECANGASGLIGHKYIVVDRAQFSHADGLRFRCSLCGNVWRRNRGRGDLFVWHRDEMALAEPAPDPR